MENTSGQGKGAPVPAEIDRWNWGAFLLSWIWGLGNKTYLSLLVFVPFVGWIMAFVLGAKGSAWAWRNKRWDSIEHFKRVQRKWAAWGVGVFFFTVACIAGAIWFALNALKESDAYRLGATAVTSNKEAVAALGQPIATGFPSGSINESGPGGEAQLSFSVEGAQAKGTAYLIASRKLGTWKLDKAELEVNGRQQRINLMEVARVRQEAPAPAATPVAASGVAASPVAPALTQTTPLVPAASVPPKQAAVPSPEVPVTPQKPSGVRAHHPPADMRYCLQLESSEAIAKCAEEDEPK